MPAKKKNSLRADIDAFLVFMQRERGASTHTLEAYRLDLEFFAAFAADNLADYLWPTMQELAVFVEAAHLKGWAPATIARKIFTAKSFFKWLQAEEKTTSDALERLQAPQLDDNLPDVLSAQECLRLIAAPNEARDKNPLRDRAILALLWASALRVSELCDLRTWDVSIEERTATVFGKGRKQRYVIFGDAAARALEEYLAIERPDRLEVVTPYWHTAKGGALRRERRPDPPWLFLSRGAKRMSRITVFWLVKKYARRVGIRKCVHPHVLRHSCATELVRGGMDLRLVQEFLGHDSIRMTGRYVRMDEPRMRQVHGQFHPRGKEQAKPKRKRRKRK